MRGLLKVAENIGPESPKGDCQHFEDAQAGALDALQELRNAHLEASGENFQRPQRGILASALNVADIRPAQAGVLSQVVLIPAFCLPQFPNALSNPRANISTCHPSSMDVSFWLYFAN